MRENGERERERWERKCVNKSELSIGLGWVGGAGFETGLGWAGCMYVWVKGHAYL